MSLSEELLRVSEALPLGPWEDAPGNDGAAPPPRREAVGLARERILDCMAEGVIATNLEGRVTFVNAAAERLIGRTRAEAFGASLEDFLSLVDQETEHPLLCLADRAMGGRLKIGLVDHAVLLDPQGRQKPVASRGSALRDEDGVLHGSVLVLTDLSEEQHLAAQLQAAGRLESVGHLAGGIAHDFNNLITVISGYAELLKKGLDPQDPRCSDLDEIRGAVERAARLTGQLLAFSRKKVLQPQALDINSSVQGIGRLLKRVIGENIGLVVKVQPGLDPVLFDPCHLEQIVMNLAVNARDAMPQGGRLTLETMDQESAADPLRPVPPGSYVVLRVMDTGQGMEPQVQARIFEAFFTTKEKGRGTGLGLATVNEILQQHGGHITVCSEPGLGSCFKVYLPVAGKAVEPGPGAPLAPQEPSLLRGRVLLVEDEERVRVLLKRVLEEAGCQVLAAADAREALACLADLDEPIDLLLTDMIMPGRDGAGLAVEARKLRRGLRVLYISGHMDGRLSLGLALEQGDAFLEKPVDPQSLIDKVRQQLGAAPGPSSLGASALEQRAS